MDEDDEELDASMEAAWERAAVPHPRELLKREHDEQITGWMRNVALDKRGPEIESAVLLNLERKE
jgi:hypothetical protein